MEKSKDSKKETKKEPTKSAKEKKAEKRDKKAKKQPSFLILNQIKLCQTEPSTKCLDYKFI